VAFLADVALSFQPAVAARNKKFFNYFFLPFDKFVVNNVMNKIFCGKNLI
jgi:hypothetical protein